MKRPPLVKTLDTNDLACDLEGKTAGMTIALVAEKAIDAAGPAEQSCTPTSETT